MILYCDTSALVKLYLQEAGSDVMLQQANAAEIIASCRISWAEAVAATARRSRETPADSVNIGFALAQFKTKWQDFAILEVTQSLVELAGEYADTFALRGYDSVQLAAASILQASAHQPVLFACFDERLNKAAKVLGMQLL